MPASGHVVCFQTMLPAMLLEEPMLMERAMPITVAQYHALGKQGLIAENTELLRGIIVEKMPKSPLHIFLVLAFLELLQKVIGKGFHVRTEAPISCRHSEPEPDVSVVRGRKEDYLSALPQTAELVVEIAISSVGIDRKKTAIYAEAGVREYWIVLPETRQIEVYANLTPGRYAVHKVFEEGQIASSEVLPAFQVELAALFPR